MVNQSPKDILEFPSIILKSSKFIFTFFSKYKTDDKKVHYSIKSPVEYKISYYVKLIHNHKFILLRRLHNCRTVYVWNVDGSKEQTVRPTTVYLKLHPYLI